MLKKDNIAQNTNMPSFWTIAMIQSKENPFDVEYDLKKANLRDLPKKFISFWREKVHKTDTTKSTKIVIVWMFDKETKTQRMILKLRQRKIVEKMNVDN